LSADTSVSRRHAEIRFSQRGLYIIDTLSANGTYVNGERIAAEVPVPLDVTTPARVSIGRETRLVLEQARRQ